jgi:hypothetical protein
MPPTAPPPKPLTTVAIAEVRDASGKVVAKVYPTAEFDRFLAALLLSLQSAS